MTQTGADRLLIGFGSLLGFAIGGFVGGNVGSYAMRNKDERDQNDAALVLGVIGAGVGSAIGAMVGLPSPAKPAQTGVGNQLQSEWGFK